jgi:uncharacterized damage-inducible protein DinB
MTVQRLVNQLWFTRSEFTRCLDGVTDEEARRRFEPMNSISWIVGHLADQENRYWVRIAQGITIIPELNELVGYGRPPSTPPLNEMWSAWQRITENADLYLETISANMLPTHLEINGKPVGENIGTMLMRNIYHYWFHSGEAYAIRQLLGHSNLPEFVGNMTQAIYRPET